ncbi:MAG: glycerol-3-phosphate 1-O-acyltransferase PlsY [Clostridia bacterium]|jgi:glycerol-3-phosphate acyltransferase PlsY|nr:glycerol-3-phosphate 1-O-acyltransferase PlsY [Clostridia bacterium]
MTVYIIIGIVAYIIGSISFSVIFSRKFAGFDVREKGSGNAGTTNVLRTVGKKIAILTLICDALKGIVAIIIAIIIGKLANNVDIALLVQISSIMVILGHTFPIFFEFRGGKGVATSLGVLLMINWQIGLICLVFALIIMAITRVVSIGSILAAILFPVLTLFLDGQYFIVKGNYLIFSIIMALIVMFNHRTNIKRILKGNENKITN